MNVGQSSRQIATDSELILERMDDVKTAFIQTSEWMAKLTDMVDYRTREIAKLHPHISVLAGFKMTEESEERDRLHRRFGEMFHDLEKQMTCLSNLLKERQVCHDKSIDAFKQSMPEPRLTLVDKQHASNRGIER